MKVLGGFTLIEVLIAMAIFAVLSAMTFQALEGTLRTQERVESSTQEINAFMVVWSVMLQDFTQMTRRPVRDKHGDVRRAFYQGDEGCAAIFTRSGVQAGVSFSLSGMQRVSYCLEGSDLYRVVSPVLDEVHDSESRKALLLKEVEKFTIEIDPPLPPLRGTVPTVGHYALPLKGIKVVIEMQDGEFTRWFPGVDVQ